MTGSDAGYESAISHEECTCEPKVESAVYCPYCGGETYYDEHRVDAEIPEVFCENTTMSTPRYCMGCGVSVSEYDFPQSATGGSDRIDLSELTAEVGQWAAENFGDQYDIQQSVIERSHSVVRQDDVDIGAMFCTLGVNEEAGELTHSVLKRAQGIREDEEDVGPEAEMDAVGDIVVYLADFCHRRGYDLEECVQRAWDGEVSEREWDSATRADGGDENVGQ